MRIIKQCKRWSSCPICLAGETGIWHHPIELHRRWLEAREKENEGMGIKKPEPAASGGGVPPGAQRGDDWVLYPTLMEFLTCDRYEDGSSRRTATLTVFADSGTVKASCNDRDNDRVAFVSAESIAALVVILEDKLKQSSLDWRPSQGGVRRRK